MTSLSVTDPSLVDLVGAAHMQLESMRRDIDTFRAAYKFNRSFLDSAETAAVDWFLDLVTALTGSVPCEPVPRIALPFDSAPDAPEKETP